MKVSLVIPYMDQLDVLVPAIENAVNYAGQEFELVLIDNGSDEPLGALPLSNALHYKTKVTHIHNLFNIGVLPSFKQGFEESTGDIIFYTHSDVLLWSEDWVAKLVAAFEADPKLGLGGLFGARGIGEDGGRSQCYSNMQGKQWGKCDCHVVAGQHHGDMIIEVTPATVLDGVGMAFRRETMQRIIDETDMFADWRSLHHFYDKILSLKTIDLGYHVAVIPLEFDHFSGATAVRSTRYPESVRTWLDRQGIIYEQGHEDQAIYDLAESQMFKEYRQYFPITVSADYQYFSKDKPYAKAA